MGTCDSLTYAGSVFESWRIKAKYRGYARRVGSG